MPMVPTSVQFELTYACNNACAFCYNRFAGVDAPEMSNLEARRALRNISDCGVFSVNLNGGEPLMREDVFDLIEWAAALGVEMHMNTNCTMVGKPEAKRIARYLPSVCTTILSSDAGIHDYLSGRGGALQETERGIRALLQEGVYVAVNLTICRANASGIEDTLRYILSLGVQTLLLTCVVSLNQVPCDLGCSAHETVSAVRSTIEFQRTTRAFARVSFPQPFPPCAFEKDLRAEVKERNIACMIGLNTARIAPSGDVTPCTLVTRPGLGSVLDERFDVLWRRFDGSSFFRSYLPLSQCGSCVELEGCGGGCRVSGFLFERPS